MKSHQHTVPVAANSTAAPKDEIRDFMAVFPDIVRDLSEYSKKFESRNVPKLFAKVRILRNFKFLKEKLGIE